MTGSTEQFIYSRQKTACSESVKSGHLSLLTVAEVAEFLRLTPKGVYSLIENRRIPFIKVSNRVRFLESDVISWLRKNRVPTLEEKQ